MGNGFGSFLGQVSDAYKESTRKNAKKAKKDLFGEKLGQFKADRKRFEANRGAPVIDETSLQQSGKDPLFKETVYDTGLGAKEGIGLYLQKVRDEYLTFAEQQRLAKRHTAVAKTRQRRAEGGKSYYIKRRRLTAVLGVG